ncbi:metallo-beta-lactamase superfamily protein [Mytilinidion resinicola]|uniref:Metallo-beta-lactamase superfamily protein n=1 Tax=Mytilinidion resinicola TaxID=574789 RepID=A0A6A6Z231_9PEZI|nr:metallo-beta-lactamase superfamily protein [Mytilinidion resinicola]KAF2815196.1 metallo-beta-lactamase superfamily protein [Mytilinidion resinicola]
MPLTEIDSLSIVAIIDNELDPISPCQNSLVTQTGGIRELGVFSPHDAPDRGEGAKEFRMSSICCGAHGLSLMITATKGDKSHTLLFDTGPEESAWERNAKRLRCDLSTIELVHLSHWHRDHSGGMLRAIQMINEAKTASKAAPSPSSASPLVVDLHPARPDYRGFMGPEAAVSFEADPTFTEIEDIGAKVSKSDQAHTVLDDFFQISGEIPRVTPYELGLRRGIRFVSEKKAWESDELIADERLVMVNLKGKGIVVFTGCSHAGAINASKHAVALGNGAPLYAVVGGYHLADAEPAQIQATVDAFAALDAKILIPGHCSGWRVKQEIERKMPGVLVPGFVGCKYVL